MYNLLANYTFDDLLS